MAATMHRPNLQPVAGGRDDPATPQITFTGIGKNFYTRQGLLHAMGPVSLSVPEGQFLSLVGPSGCGKSTLLRLVAGLDAPSAGRMEINISARPVSPMSVVFQDYGIYPWKTVLENVRFGLEIAKVPLAEANRVAREWIRKLGLHDAEASYPAELSGGMRQRVSIARALATDPEILLMDEPFAALDAQLREILQTELLALCQERPRTVIFVTHSLEEAILLSDRVVVMSARPGRVIDDMMIPFPRPRDASLRASPEFGRIRAGLWEHLRVEVERRMQQEAGGGRR